jgi:hypothetical protein
LKGWRDEGRGGGREERMERRGRGVEGRKRGKSVWELGRGYGVEMGRIQEGTKEGVWGSGEGEWVGGWKG